MSAAFEIVTISMVSLSKNKQQSYMPETGFLGDISYRYIQTLIVLLGNILVYLEAHQDGVSSQ